MADMTREAKELLKSVAWNADEEPIIEWILKALNKLEAYENADLIERDSLTKEKLCGYCYGNDNPSLCTMDNCHKALETMIENIPRFEPTKGSDE